MIAKLLLATMITFSVGLAFAGQEAKGGNGVICKNQKPVILDYYDAGIPTGAGPNPVVDVSKLSLAQMRDLIFQRLNTVSPRFADEFLQAQRALGTYDKWRLANLKDIKDANLIYELPNDCKLFQAAVRQDRTVYLNQKWVHRFAPAQLAILEAHEYIYGLYDAHYKEGASADEVRKILRPLLSLNFNAYELAIALADFGVQASEHPYTLWQFANLVSEKNPDIRFYANWGVDGDKLQIKYFNPAITDVIFGITLLECTDVCVGHVYEHNADFTKQRSIPVKFYNFSYDGKSVYVQLDNQDAGKFILQ